MFVIFYFVLFLFGVLLGAVVNWYVDRYSWVKRFRSPWRRSVVFKRIWFDFIPVLGWFSLRRFGDSGGNTELGGKWFWVRPLFVELFVGFGLIFLYYWEVVLNGLLPAAEFLESPDVKVIRFVFHVFLLTLLLAASLTDLDDFVIPEGLTIFGVVAGLIFVTIFPQVLLPATELYFDDNYAEERLTSYSVPLHFCSPDKVDVLRDYGSGAGQDVKISDPKIVKTAGVNFRNENSYYDRLVQFFLFTIFWLFWCFSMMDRVWYFRLSFRRAFLLFIRNLYRSRTTKYWLLSGVVAPILFYVVLFFTNLMSSFNCYYLTTSFIGLVAGMWLIWSVRLVAGFVLGVEAMGFGDVVLLGMIGVFVGWQSCVVIFFLAPFAGIVPSLIGLMLGRGRMIPYGPFLSIATLFLIIFWAPIWRAMEPVLFQSSIQVAIAIQILILLLGAILLVWRKIKEKLLS
ncbi:MAG: A24 family peptidase [Planctomycetaceae bacterium]|jgi:prepilin signal peptidase PulO-like enzyme (type II secretory pathway)|nr:A24 family peptidase [Planctomycetaceae bacterium]